MAFTGTTPKEVKLLLSDIIKNSNQKNVFVGYSGNFTTDRMLSLLGYDVHSNDVSLYSKLISDIILGNNTEIKVVNKELKEVFSNWKDSKYKNLIQVMFTIRIAAFEQKKNLYQQTMYDSFIEDANKYYEKTLTKLQGGSFDFKIKSFSFCDFYEFLKEKKGKGIGFSFPPTYKGGYEKMYKFIEDSFEYEKPVYDIFDPKKGDVLFKDLLEDGNNIIYSDKEWDNLKDFLKAKINIGVGKKPLVLYSSVEGVSKNFYIQRKKENKPSKIPIIDINYIFTSKTKIGVQIVPNSDINYFKGFYMSNKVNYTMAKGFGLAFIADGKAFGFVSFNENLSTTEIIYMQSDFVVNSKAQRLSKLLIMLCKTTDVRKIIARKMLNYYESIKTSVYTDKPISMKYRGVFDLERREDGKLIYCAKFSNKTIKQTYLEWLHKQK